MVEQALRRTRGLDAAGRRAAEDAAVAVAGSVLELLAELGRADPAVAAALHEMTAATPPAAVPARIVPRAPGRPS